MTDKSPLCEAPHAGAFYVEGKEIFTKRGNKMKILTSILTAMSFVQIWAKEVSVEFKPSSNNNTQVCLDMKEMSFSSSDSISQDKEVLRVFRRYLEYSISHEKGFEHSQTQCTQKVVVELYHTSGAWSAFARYSGTSREEMVDRLYPTEIKSFSERIIPALFHNKSLKSTLNRNNVIGADSYKKNKKVKGESNMSVAIGASPRVGRFQTKSGNSLKSEPIFYTATVIELGSKYRYEDWTVAAVMGGSFNPNLNSLLTEDKTGEVRFSHELGLGLHFMYSPNITGLKGIYTGGGGTFNMQTFKAFGKYSDQNLYAGGMNLDILLGYEMFRVSKLGVFIQSEINLPTYIAQGRKTSGHVNTWTPGATLLAGVNF